MSEAMETKELYENVVIKKHDDKLNVSYWFRHDGKPYVFVTTEKEHTKNYFENDKGSLIGCGFVDPSKIVQWDNVDKTRVRAFDYGGNEIPDHGCIIDPRVETITSIVCSSYQHSGTSNQEDTVGICIFTGSGKPILVNNHRQFLRDRTIKFYHEFRTLIENNKVTPLADRIKTIPPQL